MRHRYDPLPATGKWLRRVVQGYLNYHAVPGNLRRLGAFRAEVCRSWLHALAAAQSALAYELGRFGHLVDSHVPKVRVLHPYPNQRFAS